MDWPKQKAVVFMLNLKIYATPARHNSIVVWLLGRSSCSSPSTKELHDIVICLTAKNASVLDGIPGLLDMGGDCRSRGREFESWYIVYSFCWCVFYPSQLKVYSHNVDNEI